MSRQSLALERKKALTLWKKIILSLSILILSLFAICSILFGNNEINDVRHLALKLRRGSNKRPTFELTNRVKKLLQNKNNAIKKTNSDKETSPMKLEEIFEFLTNFLHKLHERCLNNKEADHKEIWEIYHNLAMEELYPWDREYLARIPERRRDGTIFLGLASYRDENCLPTMKQAYAKAKNPEKLFVGLVQQNCEEKCRTGVLTSLKMEDTEPDEDCHRVFCESDEGRSHCDAGRVRALHVNETESLGPYAARYFGSKLWYGEEWFMQIDSHMTFAQDWDALSIEMLENAPSNKPVISHYPPTETFDFENNKNTPGSRLCGGIIAESDLESQIVRLQVTVHDKKFSNIPKFNPVIAAGYFVASSEFLSEVPFDPFLPWIFMGEEIIMSARMWTHGYDIFSPTQNVVGHIYFRRHKPKFWENVHRVFHYGVHNPLQMMILNRVKYQIGYPEASIDMIQPPTLLSKVEEYTLGKERSLDDYLKMAGYDFNYKLANCPEWCNRGVPPPLPIYEKYKSLYTPKY